jgi:hypothetical protein
MDYQPLPEQADQRREMVVASQSFLRTFEVTFCHIRMPVCSVRPRLLRCTMCFIHSFCLQIFTECLTGEGAVLDAEDRLQWQRPHTEAAWGLVVRWGVGSRLRTKKMDVKLFQIVTNKCSVCLL